MTARSPASLSYRLNRLRYLRILHFFGRLTTEALWWYVLLQPLVGQRLVRMGQARRFRRWARDFRNLAVQMGGVMIKLGQFVSSRVDVLPPEVIEELAGLQDEVPPAPFAQMARTLQQELGPDWHSRFSSFDETPVAAASLGQAYRAALADGSRVAVKVQRPGIEDLVHTDLRALEAVARFAMLFGFIARRANVPLLLEEFARVLWEELDYIHEAGNAERFAELFADDPGVYIPAVYHEHSTRRVLVLEDVTAIKLNDYEAIEAAGIDRHTVAQRLIDTYLKQIFIFRFFHADPHPGNIFIYPLPPDTGRRQRSTRSRPFYLIFVDFGMTAELTPEITAGLRETLIALITRDAHRLVLSYQQLGVLLPGADLSRIEKASQAVFDEVWGLNMSELMAIDYTTMRRIARDFSDLLYTLPFQVPQDFVYLGRAVGILSGMCTGLDPAFDPWRAIQPFVQRLLLEDSREAGSGWAELLTWENMRALLTPEAINLALTTGRDALTRTITLPMKADRVLSAVERGQIEVQVRPDDVFKDHMHRIERAVRQVVVGLVFASLVLTGALLYTSGAVTPGVAAFALAGITFVALLLGGRR